MAQPQQWKPEELDRWKTPTWTFCHNLPRVSPSEGKRNLNQFLHQRNERSGNLEDQCIGHTIKNENTTEFLKQNWFVHPSGKDNIEALVGCYKFFAS